MMRAPPESDVGRGQVEHVHTAWSVPLPSKATGASGVLLGRRAPVPPGFRVLVTEAVEAAGTDLGRPGKDTEYIKIRICEQGHVSGDARVR